MGTHRQTGVPRSEPVGGCEPQGMGVDRQGATGIGVVLSAGTEGTKEVAFGFHGAKEGRSGCPTLFSGVSLPWATWALVLKSDLKERGRL